MSKKKSGAGKTESASKVAKKVSKLTGKEARASGQRIPVNLLVDYKSEGHYLFDFCKDLGSGGIFIETEAPLPSGHELELTFTIPDSHETIQTKGKVMWSQARIKERPELASGMGVQFSEFSQVDRDKLEAFVRRYNPKYKNYEFKDVNKANKQPA
ncbi:MAG: TIGR02266 family protein [Oligoflexales bacterium]|nr:TIGR02266 family protein [Oligoflexales bacterium]